VTSASELWWTVALEAALFFSVPSWLLTVEPAWPADNPARFALSVFVGASAAFLVCHVILAASPVLLVARWLLDRRK
jgi:hypothetical protein